MTAGSNDVFVKQKDFYAECAIRHGIAVGYVINSQGVAVTSFCGDVQRPSLSADLMVEKPQPNRMQRYDWVSEGEDGVPGGGDEDCKFVKRT